MIVLLILKGYYLFQILAEMTFLWLLCDYTNSDDWIQQSVTLSSFRIERRRKVWLTAQGRVGSKAEASGSACEHPALLCALCSLSSLGLVPPLTSALFLGVDVSSLTELNGWPCSSTKHWTILVLTLLRFIFLHSSASLVFHLVSLEENDLLIIINYFS